jgi:hypothetical protein
MNIILVCINNFQDYILININKLIKLEHKNIYVITNNIFFSYFEKYNDQIKLIAIEDLNDSYNFNYNTTLDNSFRNGFWVHASSRFFYIYEAMKKYNIENVIHLENDVLIYYNCNVLLNKLDKKYVYIPFDTFTRNIASIIYIPDHNIFKNILDNYDKNNNDMYNFSLIMRNTNLIDTFPIFIENKLENDEYQFVTKNFNKFNFIFDAAAIGQYLGGVDKRNDSNNTVGFINETCIIKYNLYNILFLDHENIKKPFINVNDKLIPIFNLHIHSKELEKFVFYD